MRERASEWRYYYYSHVQFFIAQKVLIHENERNGDKPNTSEITKILVKVAMLLVGSVR